MRSLLRGIVRFTSVIAGVSILGITILNPQLTPAVALPEPCQREPGQDFCIGNTVGGGGTAPVSPRSGGGGTGGGTTAAVTPPCGWEVVPAGIAEPMAAAGKSQNGSPPPGLPVTWLAWCFTSPNFQYLYGPYRWEPTTPVTPTPATTAHTLYQQLQGRMPDPHITTSPPRGTASIIGIPVFITATNWQPAITISKDLAGTTVTVHATPQLRYTPAEPDSTTITCSGPGTPYNPHGPDPTQQAASPTTCTHTYRHRTNTPGRPDHWPATATIHWTITWTASDGSHGTFPDVDRTTPIPRSVHEVQTVLTH